MSVACFNVCPPCSSVPNGGASFRQPPGYWSGREENSGPQKRLPSKGNRRQSLSQYRPWRPFRVRIDAGGILQSVQTDSDLDSAAIVEDRRDRDQHFGFGRFLARQLKAAACTKVGFHGCVQFVCFLHRTSTTIRPASTRSQRNAVSVFDLTISQICSCASDSHRITVSDPFRTLTAAFAPHSEQRITGTAVRPRHPKRQPHLTVCNRNRKPQSRYRDGSTAGAKAACQRNGAS